MEMVHKLSEETSTSNNEGESGKKKGHDETRLMCNGLAFLSSAGSDHLGAGIR